MRPVIFFLLLLGACSREVPPAKPVVSEVTPPPAKSVAAIPDVTPQTKGGIQWGAPVSDLRFGIELDGAVLVTHLQNVGSVPLVVWSHVATHERQSDWLTLRLTDRFGKERLVVFSDDRDKSAPVAVTLAAGKELADRWELADWTARHGGKAFGPDVRTLSATYTVGAGVTSIPPVGDKSWSGTVESGRIVR